MRKALVGLVALTLIGVACASNDNTGSGSSSSGSLSTAPSTTMTPAECAQQATLLSAGSLTIGTDNPAYSPYFAGGTAKGSDWKINDPSNNKGFEDVVAYTVADRMGFTPDQVSWIPLPYTQSYAPGPKAFDMYLAQVSYKPARAHAADFSDPGYYDVSQALVAVKGTPITHATSITDLKQYTLAAPLGSTSYDYIVNEIQPDNPPGVYQTLSDTVAAINAGQVDGIVVDYPTALYLADPYVQEVKDSTVVGQFPIPAGSETPEHFSIVLPLNSSLTPCVSLALAQMKDDGTLAAIQQKWLSEKTNVGTVPVFTP
jgi:polar amino acid transport system substrate-binding protein